MRNGLVDTQTPAIENHCYQPYPTAGGSGDAIYFSSSTSVGRLTDVVDDDGMPAMRMTRFDDTALALYSARGAASLWRTARGNIIEGEVWTIMYMARSNVDTSISHVLGYGSGSSNYGNPGSQVLSLLANQWQSVRRMFTVTPEMVIQGTMFNKWNIATTLGIGNYVDFAKFGVFRGAYLGPFMAGDHFNAAWRGGVNVSQSVGYADGPGLIRNLHPRGDDPRASYGWSSQTPAGSTVTYDTNTGPTGGPAMSVTIATAGQLRLAHMDANRRVPVTEGVRYTIAAWLYSPRAMNGVSFENRLFDVAEGSQFVAGTTFSVVPGWQFVRSFITIPAGRISIGGSQILSPANAPNRAEVGDIFRLARAMIVQGEYQGDYADGNTPGWRWDGAPKDSTSRGRPYTLEGALVGFSPVLNVTNVVAGTDYPVPVGPLTVIAIQDARSVSNNPGYYEISKASWSVTLGRRRVIGNGSTTRLDQMRTGGLGATNLSMAAVGAHLMQHTMTDTESRFWWEERTTEVLLASASAFPMDQEALRVGRRDNGVQNLPSNATTTAVLIVLSGAYSLTQTMPIRRWLANKYGFALAA